MTSIARDDLGEHMNFIAQVSDFQCRLKILNPYLRIIAARVLNGLHAVQRDRRTDDHRTAQYVVECQPLDAIARLIFDFLAVSVHVADQRAHTAYCGMIVQILGTDPHR